MPSLAEFTPEEHDIIAEELTGVLERLGYASAFQAPDLVLCVFPQEFSNTAGIFSNPGTIAGQAFITSMILVTGGVAGPARVYADGVLAYTLPDPMQPNFMEDLNNQRLQTQHVARELYGAVLP